MTRLVQRSLTLILFAASLVVLGCSGSSSNKDATLPDGHIAVPDGPNAPKLDASHDLAPIPPADGPVADGPVVTPDAAPVVTPDTGIVITPDASADNPAVTVDAGPVVPVDAPADRPADRAAADSGVLADGSTDSLPANCTPFTGGDVLASLTLFTACSPYTITNSIYVDGNAVLTIQPGVTLKFTDSNGINVGYNSAAKLVAVGTAQDPIVFTSAASTPGAGDWANIYFWDNTMAGSQIAYAKLDYCGSSRDGCIVGSNVRPNRVTLDHLTIDHVGVRSDGILENDVDSNFVITNSTFSNIPTLPFPMYAISVQAPSFAGIGAGNAFNGGAMIQLAGGTVAATTAWADPGTAIAVTDDLSVDGTGNPVLTLGPGMTLKFDAARMLSVGYTTGGTLVVAGTAAKHVALTSLMASPTPGVWVGVQVWDAGTAQLSYADISYGGYDGDSGGNVILESGNSISQLVADHSSFTYSLGYGIYVACAIMTDTPLATVTLDATDMYANNEIDMTNTGTQAANVGPGLNGPDCPGHHH